MRQCTMGPNQMHRRLFLLKSRAKLPAAQKEANEGNEANNSGAGLAGSPLIPPQVEATVFYPPTFF